jgi:thiol:disulfide interchange protein
VFSDKKVLARLEELNVLLIKVDNTAESQEISDDLARFGRYGLPTNIVYPADPDASPIIMPETIYAKDALEALEQAVAASKKGS